MELLNPLNQTRLSQSLFTILLTAAILSNVGEQTETLAGGRLSRTRNAVRKTPAPPTAEKSKPAPAATPAPKPQPENPQPTRTVTAPAPSAPSSPPAAPSSVARARSATRSRPLHTQTPSSQPSTLRKAASAPSPQPKPKPSGRLSQVRKAVRKPVPPLSPPHNPHPGNTPPPPARDPHTGDGHRHGNSKHGHNHGFRSHGYRGGRSYGGDVFIHSYVEPPVIIAEPCPPEVILPRTPLAPAPGAGRKLAPPPEAVQDRPVVELPRNPDFEAALRIPPLRFLSFPYQHGIPGVMTPAEPDLTQSWSARTVFEYGFKRDGLDRRGVGILAERIEGIGIDFKWDSYREDLGGGDADELHISDLNLMYRLIDSERCLIRAGIGMNLLGDAIGTETGINFTSKVELFPVQPFVLSGELDLGTIGDAEMFHGVLKAGLMLDRFEVFGGYDYRDIGGVKLEGPMAGLNIWF